MNQLHRCGLAALTVLIAASIGAQPGPPPFALDSLPEPTRAALETIEAGKIMPTIRFLASNQLEGREAGERGERIAAAYLVSRFQAAGLVGGTSKGFLQTFDLRRRYLVEEESLSVTRTAGSGSFHRDFDLGRDWMPMNFSEQGEVEAEVVFAGYGIISEEHGWDDYKALGKAGARGKVAVVFRYEPDEMGAAGNDFFDGKEMTLAASFRQKARNAAAQGALALVVVDPPIHHEVDENPRSSLSRWQILDDEQKELALDSPELRRQIWPDTPTSDRPLGVVGAHVSQALLAALDPARDWTAVQKQMDEGRRPTAFEIPDATMTIHHGYKEDRVRVSNVIAKLPGSDPELAEEFVIVGGHYDHVGKDEDTDEIYNGADDNASGTAAVVALAEAFASLPEAPKRTIVFAAWTAEELGLLGSDWFVHNPPVDLGKMVAGINLDMIGRNKATEISVVGRTETPDLVELFDRFAAAIDINLNDDAGAGASRSDNASLWMAGVPTASLFSGTHEDYHEPGDVASKVVPIKVEKATRLSFLVLDALASGEVTPERLKVPEGPWESVGKMKGGD